MTAPVGPTPWPLVERLRDNALVDDGRDWWMSALLREAAAALDAYERLETACVEMREANRGQGEFTKRAWVAYDDIIDALDDLRRSQKETR